MDHNPGTRITAAPALALAALATVPLAAAVRIAAHVGDPQTVALLSDKCDSLLITSAVQAAKFPLCAGD